MLLNTIYLILSRCKYMDDKFHIHVPKHACISYHNWRLFARIKTVALSPEIHLFVFPPSLQIRHNASSVPRGRTQRWAQPLLHPDNKHNMRAMLYSRGAWICPRPAHSFACFLKYTKWVQCHPKLPFFGVLCALCVMSNQHVRVQNEECEYSLGLLIYYKLNL